MVVAGTSRTVAAAGAATRDRAQFRELLERGLAARRSGDRPGALDLFLAAGRHAPNNPRIICEAATEQMELGRLEDAERLYDKALSIDGASLPALRGLARLARKRGDHERALAMLERVASLDSGSARVLVELAACHRHKGDGARAIAMLERAAALEPGNVGANLALAADYQKAWQLEKAAALYQAVLSCEPSNVAALVGKAIVERKRGNAAAALDCLKIVVAKGANQRAAISAMLNELRMTKQYAEARELLAQLMQDAPNDCGYLLHLAKVEHAAGQLEQSSSYLAEVIEREPSRIEAYVERAAVEYKLGRLARAAQILNDALSRDPEHSGVLAALGDHAWAAENLEQALRYYRRASSASPANVSIKWKIARCLLMLGKVAECFDAIDEVAVRRGASPEYFVTKGRVLLQLGESTAARALLAEAVQKYPSHVQLWFESTSLDIEMGRHDVVARALMSPPAYADAGTVDFLRGAFAASQWEFDRAQACFEQAAAHDSQKPGPLVEAAKCALLDLELTAAQENLRRLNRVKAAQLELKGASTKTSQTHIGQLIDEFRCEPAGLARLLEIKRMAVPDRLDALVSIVRDYPDYTAAAMFLLIELRLRNVLKPSPTVDVARPAIPRRTAQFWDAEELPPDIERLARSWREQNPDMDYVRFSEPLARDYLLRVDPQALRAFERARQPAMKADLFRLAYLHHDGGFYIDADDRCVAPLSTIDWHKYNLVLYQEDLGSIGNNFIAAAPHHPVIADALEQAVQAVDRGDVEMLWLSTGPGLISRTMAQHLVKPATGIAEALRGTLILERHELLAVASIHCRISYKLTAKHWSHTTFSRSRRARSSAEDAPVRRRVRLPAAADVRQMG
jgi:tetratricopeptide (TPR) repeat protein